MTRSPRQIPARALLLCLAVACQGDTTTPTPPNPYGELLPAGEVPALLVDDVLATLAVVPDSQIVFVGDRFKITAKPRNAAGQLLERIVRWTVGTPTVAKALDSLKATMTFRALRVGSTSIRATVDGKSRSAKVIVRSTTGAKVVVTPATATVVAGGTVRFTATGVTQTGETAGVEVTWTATGGTISGVGVLTAGKTPGTYRVIAKARFDAADTSLVTITSSTTVAKVILMPATTSVVAGSTTQFAAYGRTSAGDSVPVAVTYTATGGTIATSGVYTAGRTAGTYRVIAKNTAGLADTSAVVVSPAPIAQVRLMPERAASRAGATTRFVATMWNTLGDSVPQSSTYESTCGSMTSAGLLAAPLDQNQDCRIVATVEGKADTSELVVLPTTRDRGVPYGVYDMWTSATAVRSPGVAAFTASMEYISPADIVRAIAAARASGVRLMLPMTGGSHDRYKTDGVFDEAKWRAAMDAYNTPAIRDAMADGVADGTVIGNSVMDEPQQSGTSSKSWGPVGTMTKVRIDGMCAYVKAIFPTLPVGVGHDHAAFEPGNSYRVCDFFLAQYAYRKTNGDIQAYRDAGLAMATRDGMQVVFSLNLLDGGTRNLATKLCPIPETGGYGTQPPNCRMNPTQIRDWGRTLGQAGCAMLGWRFDAAFMGNAENQQAFSDVAMTLSDLPRKSCSRPPAPNSRPSAAFASSCDDLACRFSDESTDPDGVVTAWKWDFGDGNTSTLQHPEHAYSQEGSYQVQLTVTDNDDATGTVTQTVTVTAPPPANEDPAAAFSSSCDGLTCAFTDESTDDGGVAAWSWDFGDGSGSTARHPSHTYEAEGSYQVTLEITDHDLATGTVTQTVTAGSSPAAP
ncbi:MAG TPA: PKD domain-containing protein [Gemmatimonadales bacterium]|nr:PKD domain-containing protein [Gemmatimonadales bacterium]